MISELFSGNVFLWTCVWQSTICVVVGLVGSFVFRHWPARAHRVLFVAMIAAMIVPILSSLVRYFELGVLVAEPAVIQSGVEDLPRVNNYEAPEIMPDEDFEYKLNIAEEYSAPVTVAQSEGVNIPWGRVILWGWGAASLILTLRLVLTFVLGVRLLGRALPLGREKIQSAVHVARAKLGFGRNVEVYSSAGVCSPVIWCWGRRPVLLVPSGSGRVDNRVNWVSVLCHELAHWKRRDHISGLLAELMVCIFPWNPLMWWAKRRLVSLSEQACDDWVLASGQLDTNYAQSLLDLAPQGQMAFVPAVVSSKKALGARIRRILKDRRGQPRTGKLWALVVGIVAMCVAVGVAFAQTRPARAEEAKGKGAAWAKQSEQYALPAGWSLDYDDGTNSIGSEEGKGGRHWRSGMADDLAELRIIPTPANEYDESWKEERIRFEIHSLNGKRIGQIDFRGKTVSDRIVLAPDKYVLSYTRGAVDLESNCTIPLDSTKFEVDLSGAGMYQLKFSPKLKDSGTVVSDKYPPSTCKGKVIDVNGNRLGRIKVAAYEMFFNMAGGLDMRLIGETVTKEDGAFVFETRPSVKKSESMGGIVVAQKKGLSVGWAEWPLYGTQQVTLTLSKPAKLAGFVVDENGEGIADAGVRAVLFRKKTSEKERTKWLPGIGPLSWLAVRTDRQGRFEFNNIPADVRADLVVLAAGFSTIYTHRPQNLRVGYEGAEFAPGITDIKVTIAAEGRIEGKVVDSKSGEGVAGVKLAVVPTFSPVFFERFVCTSKQDGTFSIGGLRSGKYLIRGDFPSVYVDVKSGQKANVEVKIKRPRSGSVRIVHFPKDRSLGTLKVQTFEPSQPYKLDITGYGDEWQYFGQAEGDVTVPAGKRLQLVINKPNQDLSPLRRLRPDDLYMLIIDCGVNPASNADVTIMPHLSGLTELKVLYLFRANITGRGLRHIRGFKSLRRLILSLEQRIDNSALAELANLESLQELVVSGRFTDRGLRHLEKLTSLRELSLEVTRVRGPGLAYLEKLPQLRYLQLAGRNFGDDGLAYVKNLKSLKKLHLFGQLQITDAGLAHLSNLTGLEELKFTWIEGITDAGLVHLKPLSKLKKLDFHLTKLGDKGIAHLRDLKSLESLEIRGNVTDQGLADLSELEKLEYLIVGGNITDEGLGHLGKLQFLETLWIDDDGITDAGMSYIAKLTNLKELLISSRSITDQGLANLTELKSLKRLYLHDAKLTVSGLAQLNALPSLAVLNASLARDDSVLDLSGMTGLEELSLDLGHDTDQYWTDADLVCLAKLSNLKWLQLYPHNFSDVGMAHLADLTNLERLGIGGGRLTDDGLLYLANMNKLNHLTISEGDFTDEALHHLEGHKSLRYLNITSENTFSKAAVKRLYENLPNVQTLSINGESTGYGTMMGGGIESDGGQRVLHFPKDRSLGELKIRDADTIGRVKDFYNMGKPDWWFPDWESLGEAKGDVTIPAGKLVALRVSEPQQWRDLSPLGRLKKDDLYFLCIEGSFYGGPKPRDACMKHITRLTGLKRLEIMYTDITARGIQQIEKLKSLETLVIAGKLDDGGLAVISKLPSLKYFYIHHLSQITNAGMRHVGRMKLLEELVISGGMVGDEGLVHLSKLPRLRFLHLYGDRFTDDGMKHLKNIPNLKSLQVYWLKQLTDKALMHIAKCDSLETVSFYHNENITDKGLEYLSTIKSLKRLDINEAHITDEGMKHLAQIKSLEQLKLPYRYIGDQGLIYLSNLSNLKYLVVSLDDNDQGFYTDKGVKALSKLGLLEHLKLGSRGMTDKSMEYISTLTQLKDFSLGEGTSVTDKGLAQLNNLTSLERLKITFANITISGLSSLNNLSNLKRLYVEGLIQDGDVLDISGMTKLEELTLIHPIQQRSGH